MFRLFKKKTHKQLLEENYKKLLVHSLRLSRTDPKTSDRLAMEADDLLEKIMNLRS